MTVRSFTRTQLRDRAILIRSHDPIAADMLEKLTARVDELEAIVRIHMQSTMKFADLITKVGHNLDLIIKAETVVYDEDEKSDVIVAMDETEMVALAEDAVRTIAAALRNDVENGNG